MKKFLTFLAIGTTLSLMGAALIHCGGGNDGGCTSNTDCKTDEYCDLTSKTCQPNTTCNHLENCAGKCCGDDGCPSPQPCADNCAASGKQCDTDSCTCVDCQPDCVDRDCGDDGCGGSCGTCTAPEVCNTTTGKCEPCTPDCVNKVCGDDGCGGSCGTCPAGQHCEGGTCVADTLGNPGDPCTFGDVNVDAGACNTGGTCLGIAADGQSGTCTVAGDCTSLGDELNPDCVNGNCGASFCAEECPGGDVNQCSAGFVGQVISGTCYCVPSDQPIGNGDPGDPCIFGDVNSDTDNCKAGLTCLGIEADGQSGTCTTDADCSSLGDSYNPDCASGNCGASFCAEPCPGGDADQCPAGTNGQDINGTCFCLPKPADECTDPVNNTGCEAGEKCIVYQGALVCTPEGPAEYLQPCDPNNNNACKAGMGCYGSGEDFFCWEFCNGTNGTGCTGSCDSCYPDQDLPAWGVCYPLDCCDMTADDTVQCGTNYAGNPTFCSMSNPPDDCTTGCWEHGGGAEDSTCTWDDCGPNLFCTFYLTAMGDADSGTCVPRCDTAGSDCTSPDTCGHIDAITGCDGSWGICGQ